MKNLVFSAIAVLALATAPALAAPDRHVTTHRTVHTTSHMSHGTTHTTRSVTTRRTVRTNHTGRNWHGRAGWHRATGVHVSVNVGGLRANITSPRRYRYVGVYSRPSGWYAHRWAYGQRLPVGWYASSFWLSNYAAFGLVAPTDGYQWIREGNDAVLVDTSTGEIVRVEYNVFY